MCRYYFSAFFALLLATSVVQAEEAADFCPASQEYIKNLPAANDVAAFPLSSGREVSSCLLDWRSLTLDTPDTLFVDIRLLASEKSLPGTLPINLTELKTKAFLKKKTVVLLDEGYSANNALKACALLKRAGFKKVKALKGGVRAYASANQYPIGRKELLISPRDFLNAYSDHQVIVVAGQSLSRQGKEGSSVKTDESYSSLSGSLLSGIKVDYFYSPGSLQEAVLERMTSAGNTLPVVVIGSEATPEEAIGLASKLSNIFYLEGGLNALIRYQTDTRWTNKRRKGIPQRYLCGNV
jgi:rhodanese-related sulfurtransferase